MTIVGRWPLTLELGVSGPRIHGARGESGRIHSSNPGDPVPSGDGPYEENVPSTLLSLVEGYCR